MMDEDEIQRRELSRLLTTAKDEQRKEQLRKAITDLDNAEKACQPSRDTFYMHVANPSLHASLFSSPQISLIEGRSSSKMRPASAQRRPSMSNLLLDVIHEHPTASKTHNSLEKIDEFILPLEDIAEVISSSFDCRFPPKRIFHHTTGGGSSSSAINSPSSSLNLNSSGNSGLAPFMHNYNRAHNHNGGSSSNLNINSNNSSNNVNWPASWVSTGLLPQFLSVMFYEKWLIRKIEIHCRGIERIDIQINTNASSTAVSAAKLVAMWRTNEDTFTLDFLDEDHQQHSHNTSSNSLRDRGGGTPSTRDAAFEGVPGIGIMIVISKASTPFYSISEVKIRVMPQG